MARGLHESPTMMSRTLISEGVSQTCTFFVSRNLEIWTTLCLASALVARLSRDVVKIVRDVHRSQPSERLDVLMLNNRPVRVPLRIG